MLADSYGRIATDLRVSLTDRCNLRCSYCMPPEGLDWLPNPALLTDGELARLIVHQRDKRRDDERGASAGDGGELVAERFSCSGGHDEQDVAAIGGGSADGLLVGPEFFEAEGLVEEGFEVHQPLEFRILFV